MKLIVRYKDIRFDNYYYDDDANGIYEKSKPNVIDRTVKGKQATQFYYPNDDLVPVEAGPVPHITLNDIRYRLDEIIAYTVYGNPPDIIKLFHIDNDYENCHWSNLEWLLASDVASKYRDLYKVADVREIDEEWKEFKFPNRPDKVIEVSNQGRLRTLDHKIIEPHLDTGGYAVIGYNIPGVGVRNLPIHRAVATAFVHNPNPEHFTIVNHIDGNKINNCFWNLEWVDYSKNSYHASSTGLATNQKVSEDIVREVCKSLSKGISPKEIEAELGVSQKFISRIYTRQRWSNISKDYTFPSKQYSPEEKENIRNLIADGLKAKEVAMKLGLNYDKKFVSLYKRQIAKYRSEMSH